MNTNQHFETHDQSLVLQRLDQLIAAVLNTKVAPRLSPDVMLWNTAQIADYLGISYKYTSEYIVTHHNFPPALRIPTKDGKPGHPRWYAGEVLKWVSSHRE